MPERAYLETPSNGASFKIESKSAAMGAYSLMTVALEKSIVKSPESPVYVSQRVRITRE